MPEIIDAGFLTNQQLEDRGVNPFAAELLAESYARGPARALQGAGVRFETDVRINGVIRRVRITLERLD